MLTNTLEYKGYMAKIKFSAEDQVLYGKIKGIKDLISFESCSAKKIKKEFHDAVDDYLLLQRKTLDDLKKPRLTDKKLTVACCDPWDFCGIDHFCKRDCFEPEPCKIPEMVYRLAELENAIESGELMPVVHGRWINDDDGYYRCSRCHQKAPMIPQYQDEPETELTKYCPKCAAIMDLEGENER